MYALGFYFGLAVIICILATVGWIWFKLKFRRKKHIYRNVNGIIYKIDSDD